MDLASDDHLLALTVRHVAADRWSMGLIARDLASLYTSIVTGRPSTLPDLPVQYADYVAWRREDADKAFAAQARYWKRRMKGVQPLPRFVPRPSVSPADLDDNVQTAIPEFSAGTTAALRTLCRKERVSTFIAVLAVFKLLLLRYTSASDIVVDCQTANRMRPDLRDMVGCLYNLLRLRSDLSGDPSLTVLLPPPPRSHLEAFANQELEMDTLLDDNKKRDDALAVRQRS
jgi:hypothetical protein